VEAYNNIKSTVLSLMNTFFLYVWVDRGFLEQQQVFSGKSLLLFYRLKSS